MVFVYTCSTCLLLGRYSFTKQLSLQFNGFLLKLTNFLLSREGGVLQELNSQMYHNCLFWYSVYSSYSHLSVTCHISTSVSVCMCVHACMVRACICRIPVKMPTLSTDVEVTGLTIRKQLNTCLAEHLVCHLTTTTH